MIKIDYLPKIPKKLRPIYIFGAGGIVHDAHLPAYQKVGFHVAGIFNRKKERAENLAKKFDIENVYETPAQMIEDAPQDAIFDLALMPDQFTGILQQLPKGSAVLIQKPMGNDIQQTEEILNICRQKELMAAINCQLRYAPFVKAARSLINQGLIGDLYDMEINVTVHTPWEYFPNVMHHPRLEIQQHSIHYIDLMRSFFGEPKGIYSKTVGHPEKTMSSTRTVMILDYGNKLRSYIHTNHDHHFDGKHQQSYIKWEGTKGAIFAQMGLLMDYPQGTVDKFEYCLLQEDQPPEWVSVDLKGSWFPEAFIDTMSSLMRFASGEIDILETSVEDVYKTMQLVEAAYA